MKEYTIIGKIDINKIGKYKDGIITDEVILTNERLYNHILVYHKREYEILKDYIIDIIEKPDFIIEDNKNENTLILMKRIHKLKENGRVVIKLAMINDRMHSKNSIITMMKLNERTWRQTIKNRGNIIFKKYGQKRINNV